MAHICRTNISTRRNQEFVEDLRSLVGAMNSAGNEAELKQHPELAKKNALVAREQFDAQNQMEAETQFISISFPRKISPQNSNGSAPTAKRLITVSRDADHKGQAKDQLGRIRRYSADLSSFYSKLYES